VSGFKQYLKKKMNINEKAMIIDPICLSGSVLEEFPKLNEQYNEYKLPFY
jgi:hypothetical protein